MPVIVPEPAYDTWLAADTAADQLKRLLLPYPAGRMAASQVDPPPRVRPAVRPARQDPGLFDGYDA